ncbi:hypothetical protein FOA43_002746 [Brettanomyces nanus]|uniref:Exonuclease V, mitochondrial n=1 Tax=Eeniella nana TaxID=13502 RepID=A0A875S5U6_EENNA|nr:uncharacterized protein FOA43_002746 [Brettanomyces nanus]QPG75392.1 hypothetical protein FOA43_002746 [Brettanomyces nanus]
MLPSPFERLSLRCFSSLQGNLKRVNTCTLRLQIPTEDLPETEPSNQETSSSSDSDSRNDLDSQSPDHSSQGASSQITDSDVEKAIKHFVTRKPSNYKAKANPSSSRDALGSSELINPHKYDSLAQILTANSSATILPLDFIVQNDATPYDQLLRAQGEDLQHPKNHARLSVTKILPFNWCELKSMFNVYSGVFQKTATKPMLRGKVEHSTYEHATHPAEKYSINVNGITKHINIEKTRSFMKDTELPVQPIKEYDLQGLYAMLSELPVEPVLRELASNWTSTILRLLTLFQFGECREVLVQGLYNKAEQALLQTDEQLSSTSSSDYIIISGVIDHLVLESGSAEGAFDGYQEELRDSIPDFLDISELINQIQLKADRWCDQSDSLLYITVKDLKTRRTRSLPHPLQQQSAKYQVGMYRKFLEILSIDPKLTYQMLLINARKRGIDPYSVLPEPLVIELVLGNYYLIKDFDRLKHGKPIGFAPYDNDSHIKGNFNISSAGKYTIGNNLSGDWTNPPTLAYLAARLAQLHHSINPFLSSQNFIEYSCQGKVFRQIKDIYHEEDIDSAIRHGMDLWLGHREPETPFIKSICKNCEFRKQCEWHLRQEGAINNI